MQLYMRLNYIETGGSRTTAVIRGIKVRWGGSSQLADHPDSADSQAYPKTSMFVHAVPLFLNSDLYA